MPELYAALADKLDPQFVFVTGSPYQLYPFLHDFINTTYNASTVSRYSLSHGLVALQPCCVMAPEPRFHSY